MAPPDRTTPPHLQSSRDVAGSLADHVRQYTTADPQEADLRDRLAGTAEDFANDHQSPQDAPSLPERAAEGQQEDDSPAIGEEEWFDGVPEGNPDLILKNGGRATHSGGLWTVTWPDGSRPRQQFGTGYFVNSMGPFKRA